MDFFSKVREGITNLFSSDTGGLSDAQQQAAATQAFQDVQQTQTAEDVLSGTDTQQTADNQLFGGGIERGIEEAAQQTIETRARQEQNRAQQIPLGGGIERGIAEGLEETRRGPFGLEPQTPAEQERERARREEIFRVQEEQGFGAAREQFAPDSRTQSTQFGDVTPPRGFRVGGGGNLIPVPGQAGQPGRMVFTSRGRVPESEAGPRTFGAGPEQPSIPGTTTTTAGSRGTRTLPFGGGIERGVQEALARTITPDEEEETEMERRLRRMQSRPGQRTVPGAPQTMMGPNELRNFVQATFEAEDIEAAQEAFTDLLSLPEAQVSDDFVNTLNQAINTIRSARSDQGETPANLIDTTVEQEQAATRQPGIGQQIRNLKVELGEPEFRKRRIDIMKELAANSRAMQKIVRDINENPNLPAALARRRVRTVQQEFKQVNENLTAQLEIVNQSLADINDTVNDRLQIARFERDEQERRRRNKQESFELMVESGSLEAFTEEDIQNWSDATGYSAEAIRGAVNDARSTEIEDPRSFVRTDNQGNVRLVIWDASDPTGEPITKNVGKIGGTRSGGGVSDRQLVRQTNTTFETLRRQRGFVTSNDYTDALQNWIASGGNKTDFQAAFPPERVLPSSEIGQLPQDIRPEFPGATVPESPFSFSSFDISDERIKDAASRP